ncbi:hypothetical protein [Streptomyces sp. NBC_01013]|uniref:hypothetical protein n=1 Tax=Streptomyces sp. NBC_01013 TaxID=2903718 RepID=UPI00386B3818|nr:hypothetical protein OG538_04105 [Streptomyces sp. NBC_01013]
MRSENRDPGRTQLRVRDRFAAVVTTSMAVLFVEAVVATIALFVWTQVRESPYGPGLDTWGVFLLAVLAPLAAVAGAALGYLLSIGFVMPLLVVAGWAGRRFPGREAWWWVPALAAPATALPSLVVAVLGETGPWAGLGGWLAVTAVLAAAALVARRLLLPDRPRLTGGAMFGRVAWYGTLAVLTAGLLAGIGLYAGIAYEPPELSAQQIAGTWADGKGGTLILTADGRATANRVETFDADDSFEPVAHPCTGTGTWEYDPGLGPWTQSVAVSVGDCSMDTWEVFGTNGHPKLFVYVEHPDSWGLYVLRRRG